MITIQQINKDISTGKSTVIYFSEKSLWWTHLESDAEEATLQGRVYKQQVIRGALLAMFVNMDPIGNKAKIFPNAKQWMKNSQAMAGKYGKHGLKAFMKSHHQNCSNYFSNKWQGYNDLIDRERSH